MRLLVFIAIVYVCYRFFKSWLRQHLSSAERFFSQSQASGEIDDVMVKDPVCNVYFPQRQGVHLFANGQDLYFCSSECRQKFIEKK